VTDYTAIVLNERQYAMTAGEDVANTLTGTDYKGTQCVFAPKTLKIRAGCEGGGKGPLVQDDLSATLSARNDQALFEPVAFGICSFNSHSMLSRNPKSGVYEAGTSRTLDTSVPDPNKNAGGMAIVAFAQNQRDEVRDLKGKAGALAARPGAKQQTYVLEGNGVRPSHRGDGVGEDVSFTLNTVERHAVCYAMTPGCFTQLCEEQSPTLTSRDFKDPPLINDPPYAVRRLTPAECALLQGFPPWWCSGLGTPEPDEDDIAFWSEVFETHRQITGTSSRPKTRNQIVKWLRDPHTDSAEYRLWGNGVALPCVVFVLSGIAHFASLGSV
jgi:DNA (cytosine-5)-methyltransferase 1